MGSEYFGLKNFQANFDYPKIRDEELKFLNENVVEVKRKGDDDLDNILIIKLNIDIVNKEIKIIKILNALWQSKLKGSLIMDYIDTKKNIFFSRKYIGIGLKNDDHLEIFDNMSKNSEHIYDINTKFNYDSYQDSYS